MPRVLTVFAIAFAAATVLGWFGRFHAVFEMFTNVAPLMLALALILIAWATIARAPVHAAVGVVAAIWFAALLAPYAFATPEPAPTDPKVVHAALQYNVYFDNDDGNAIIAEIEAADADIVALHEITTSQWDELRAGLTDYPFFVAEPWDGGDGQLQLGGGMALLSRTPLEPLLVASAANTAGRPILAAVTTVGDREVVAVGLHPHASRFERHKVELRDEQLAAVAELVNGELRPVLILTDLNMTPTSPDYRGLLDDLGWRDPHRSTGWDASWPTRGGPFGLPIDHVLVSDHIVLHDVTTGDGGGSDHRSLRATFSFLSN